MDKILYQCLVVSGLFLLYNGYQNALTVNYPKKIIAWRNSCVLIPCNIPYSRKIERYTWYKNPIYNKAAGEFEGDDVFNSLAFGNRARLWETDKTKCTILIQDVRDEDTGNYSLRLWGETPQEKWMMHSLSIMVSETRPDFKIEHVNVPLKENQQATLECSVNYFCPEYQVNLSWTGINFNDAKDVQIVDKEGLLTKNQLTFKPSWKNHNETIKCVLTRPNEEKDSRSITLNVEYAPEGVHIWPNNSSFVIKKPEKITLECRVDSSNPPVRSFKWYEIIYENTKPLVAKDKTFTIDRTGTFKCEATNDVKGTFSNAVSVLLQYPPESVKIIKSLENVQEGDNLILECYAKASPKPTKYIWYRNGKQDFDHTTENYQFSGIREDHAGLYQCEAYNALGQSKSEPMNLDVKYKPKNPEVILDPPEMSFIEGQAVEFSCPTNRSNPPVFKIKWYKNEKAIDISKALKITSKDSGSYKCRVVNEVGYTDSESIQIKVLYQPKQVKAEVLNGAKINEGQKISLKCTASESEPRVSGYEWYKDGHPYPKYGQVIEFESIKWTESGDYACEAKHDVGNVRSQTVSVNVQYAPRQVTVSVDPSQWVTENSHVDMTCNAKANPSHSMIYEWYRNNVSVGMNPRMPTHSIYKIQTVEGGHYYCTARNQIGIGRSDTVYLHVSYSAHTIAKYGATGIGTLLVLILIALAIRFKIWRKLQRNPTDDFSDSSFFVLKKSHNELLDGGARQSPSVHNSAEHLDYSTIMFPASNDETQGPRNERNTQDPSVIYSVVRKTHGGAHEYENISTANKDQEEIHYSTIVNLSKEGTVRQSGPAVEYAMLRR